MTPEAARGVTQTVNKAITDLKCEVAGLPKPIDVEAAAERAVVTAAMRGGGKAPEDRPSDYANVSDDREFQAERQKVGV
jgi:hypothetical protein